MNNVYKLSTCRKWWPSEWDILTNGKVWNSKPMPLRCGGEWWSIKIHESRRAETLALGFHIDHMQATNSMANASEKPQENGKTPDDMWHLTSHPITSKDLILHYDSTTDVWHQKDRKPINATLKIMQNIHKHPQNNSATPLKATLGLCWQVASKDKKTR